jgi:hypothetical protein
MAAPEAAIQGHKFMFLERASKLGSSYSQRFRAVLAHLNAVS